MGVGWLVNGVFSELVWSGKKLDFWECGGRKRKRVCMSSVSWKIKCMFGFELEDCKSTFEHEITIEFLLGKCTFRLERLFTTKNQTFVMENMFVKKCF